MLAASQLRGIIPALPTPVRGDIVDAGAVSALFAWLLKQGIDGVLPLGGTGEYGALARAERIRMVELCAKAMAGKGPVIVCTDESGSMHGEKNHTSKALALAMAWVARRQKRWVA